MIFNFLLIVAAFSGLIIALKVKDKISLTITSGMSLGILLVFLQVPYIKISGLIIYLLFAIIAFIYGLIKRNTTPLKRSTICTISFPICVYWIFALLHYPGVEIIKLFMILPLFIFIIFIFKKQLLKPEISFLLILTMDALTIILN